MDPKSPAENVQPQPTSGPMPLSTPNLPTPGKSLLSRIINSIRFQAFKSSSKPHGQVNKLLIIVTLIFLVVFLLLSILSALTVYTDVNVPFFSANKKSLSVIFYRLPFAPKTPEIILIAAVEKNAKLNTYNPNFSLSADLGSSGISALSIDLEISGPIDITPKQKIAFSVNIDALVNFAGNSLDLSGEIRQKEGSTYFKLDSIPELLSGFLGSRVKTDISDEEKKEIEENTQKVLENWIILEKLNLESEARKELDKRSSEQSLIDGVRRSIQDFLLKSKVLPEVKLLKSEKIEGVSAYHLSLQPSNEALKDIFLEYAGESKELQNIDEENIINEIIDSIDTLQIDIWIGKKDAVLRKTSVQTQIKLDFLNSLFLPGGGSPLEYGSFLGLGSLISPKLSVSTVLILKDVNKKVEIEVPNPTKTFQEYSKLLTDASRTKAEKEKETQKIQINADFEAIRTQLSRYLVANNAYPPTLSSLIGSYIPSGDPLATRLSDYSYKINTSTNEFVVFIEFEGTTYNWGGASPFYGFTSGYSYNRQLTLDDLDVNLIGTPESSGFPELLEIFNL